MDRRLSVVFRIIMIAAIACAVTSLEPAAQELKDWQGLTPWRQKKLQRQADDERSKAATAGAVYKNAAFWAKFADPEMMKLIFSGNNQARRKDFGLYFAIFVGQFSSRCRNYLPPDAVILKTIENTVTRNGFGTVLREHQNVTTTYADRRFVGPFEAYGPKNDLYLNSLVLRDYTGPTAPNGGMTVVPLSQSTGIRKVMAVGSDIGRFFDAAACDSATMYQFKENMLRIEDGQPSLLDSKVSISNAAAESDPPQ